MNKILFSVCAALVACVTALSAQAEEVKGSAAEGAKKNAMCIGCHGIVGYQASFPEIHKVPKLAGQSAAYIVSALNAYKKGERKHASMRGIAESLTDQDMADLAAFYSTSSSAAALPAEAPAMPKAIEALITTKGNCASCHGANLSSPVSAAYPKIAGQYSDYLYVALKAYKIEGNPQVGRANAIMGGIAKQFSNAELKQLADYVGRLPSEMQTVPQDRFRTQSKAP